MNIEFVCKNCDKLRKLNEKEIEEIRNFIINNNLSANSIIDYLSLKDGKVCIHKNEYSEIYTYKEEHVYTFSEEFMNQIIKDSLKIKE